MVSGDISGKGRLKDAEIEDENLLERPLQCLSDAQRSSLQLCADDFVHEAYGALKDAVCPTSSVELMEICCPPDSRLVQTFLDRGHGALRIGLPAIDLSTKKGLEEVKAMIDKWRPKVAWISLPCGPFSPIQELFNENDPDKLARSLLRKKRARRLIANGLAVAEYQIQCGGEIGWEWPANNRGWNLREVHAFWEKLAASHNLHTARVDGCAYGLRNAAGEFLRKPWKINTTSPVLAQALHRLCPGRECHYHAECLGGKTARDSGFYPQAMCDVIQKAVSTMVLHLEEGVFPLYPVFDTKDMMADLEKKAQVAPLTEAERKSSLRVVERLHRKTGHPSNAALAGCLRNRGAHPEVIEMARHHQCSECQELRAAPLNPSTALEKSEVLWETLVMDNMEFTVDDVTHHFMVFVDEASRLMCAHRLFSHHAKESRNATAEEVIEGIETTWVRHYGLPAKLRMDPEGAFKSTALGLWGEERGVELLPCVAECHGQIGVAERGIQTVKATVKQILQGKEVQPWEAVIQACQTHNEFERVEGFTPFQWLLVGNQRSLEGCMKVDMMTHGGLQLQCQGQVCSKICDYGFKLNKRS